MVKSLEIPVLHASIVVKSFCILIMDLDFEIFREAMSDWKILSF